MTLFVKFIDEGGNEEKAERQKLPEVWRKEINLSQLFTS